ncbi:MAG: septation protein IspZ [Alphaproteobacteria bacterium]|nr:septation protein IspZ [Alphaproteobacteria bacterium]
MRLLLSLAPLLAFYLLEERVGLRAAVVASLVLAAVEVAWTRWAEGRWSRLTVASAGLVAVLGGLSLATDDARMVLLTPALGDLVFAGALAVGQLSGRGLLALALREQEPELDLHPLQERFVGGIAWRLAANLTVHAGLVVWAAGQPRETWLTVTGPVAFAMMGLQVAAEVAWGRLVVLPQVEADEARAWEAAASPPPEESP